MNAMTFGARAASVRPMSPELLSALLLFAVATSVTPGPNNLMLMASGANYGFRRTIPHMLGISLGHLFMVVVLGLGLAQVFTTWPVAHTVLKVLSVAYMLYLAWRIATAAPPGEAAATGRPFTFLEAAAFQWVNPKAWAMALTAISVYAPAQTVAAVLMVGAAFAAVNLPSVSVWTALGTQVRRWLTTAGRLRRFNLGMAVLLVLSLWPVVAP